MMFHAFILVNSLARQEDSQTVVAATTSFVNPWNMPAIEISDDCTTFCEDWMAPYFSSDHGCVGLNSVTSGDDNETAIATIFCPDKALIEQWTVAEELEFEGLYQYIESFTTAEQDVFKQLQVEREIKLSVNPWQMLPNEIRDSVERRRIQGSSRWFRCFGGHGGANGVSYRAAVRPTRVTVRSGRYVDRLEFTFSNGHRLHGGGRGGRQYTRWLPRCTTIVLIKHGAFVDAIQFLSQGYETPYFGGHGGATSVVVAPRGRCLGSISMNTGALVDRICLKFNA